MNKIIVRPFMNTRHVCSSECQKSFRHSEAAKRPWESVPFKVPVFLKVWIKSEAFRERIATPVTSVTGSQ